MNCDQAFDVMTDPDCPNDPQLWRHLRTCPRCRQMYETLEPALGLFAPVDDPPSSSAPAQTLSPSIGLAQRLAGRLTADGGQHPGGPPRRRLWGIVLAAGVAGFLVSVGVNSMLPTPHSVAPDVAADCLWINRRAATEDRPARALVSTCIACHFSKPVGASDDQAAVRDFSQQWQPFVRRWQATVHPPASEPLLIAAHMPRAAPRGEDDQPTQSGILVRTFWRV